MFETVATSYAIRVAFAYSLEGLRGGSGGLSDDETYVYKKVLLGNKKLPATFRNYSILLGLFAAICSEFRQNYNDYIDEFFEKEDDESEKETP